MSHKTILPRQRVTWVSGPRHPHTPTKQNKRALRHGIRPVQHSRGTSGLTSPRDTKNNATEVNMFVPLHKGNQKKISFFYQQINACSSGQTSNLAGKPRVPSAPPFPTTLATPSLAPFTINPMLSRRMLRYAAAARNSSSRRHPAQRTKMK